ncbi:MAG: PorV/PorQ family protein [candidate division WOR-3 bacterium]|nr:PorV/PorQ family protein [candidate division WOR-3 bacterium]
MKKNQTTAIIILVLTLIGLIYASEYPGAVFLMIWPGARPTSLGGAFVAIADDATAPYYNPGGLGFLNSSYATLMHSNWLPGLYPGMYYEYLGFSHSLRKQGTIGFNFIYLTTGETDVIDHNGNYLGKYTTFDVAISGSYGFKASPNVATGLSAKFIYSYLVPDWVFGAIEELRGTTGGIGMSWAFDVGVLYKPLRYLSVGASLANIGPNISFSTSGESDPLPRMLRLGVKYTPVENQIIKVNITPEITKVLVGMFYDPDEEKTFAQELNYEIWSAWKSLGIEAWLYDIFSIRIGYFEDLEGARGGIRIIDVSGDERYLSLPKYLFTKHGGRFNKIGLTFGIGVHYRGFQIDVGNDQMIYDFETSNYKFSFTYRF